jgi:hypothetical protein
MAAPAAAAASGLVVVCDQGVYEEMHPYERFAARDMVIDLAACGGRADDTAVAAMKAGREIPPPQVCVLVPHQLHLQAAALAKTGDNGEPSKPWWIMATTWVAVIYGSQTVMLTLVMVHTAPAACSKASLRW